MHWFCCRRLNILWFFFDDSFWNAVSIATRILGVGASSRSKEVSLYMFWEQFRMRLFDNKQKWRLACVVKVHGNVLNFAIVLSHETFVGQAPNQWSCSCLLCVFQCCRLWKTCKNRRLSPDIDACSGAGIFTALCQFIAPCSWKVQHSSHSVMALNRGHYRPESKK